MPRDHRAIQKRYEATPKGHATRKRYRTSAKARAVEARTNPRKNRRRLFIGRRYVGMAENAALAESVNTHIRGMVDEFRAGQRAEASGVAVDA